MVAVFSSKDNPRSVGVGSSEDFEAMFSFAYDISFEQLLDSCIEIDKVWSESSAADRIQDKKKHNNRF